jgi:hypothetical protein
VALPDLAEAWQRFHESIVAAEDLFAKVCLYSATIPMFTLRGEVHREQHGSRKLLVPVAYLHFNNGTLQFSEVRKPYPQTRATRCSICRSVCPVCQRRQKEAKSRWEARQAEREKVRDVLDLDDVSVLGDIVEALPAMHARLVSDAKVTPEEIYEAIEHVQKFLESLRVHV